MLDVRRREFMALRDGRVAARGAGAAPTKTPRLGVPRHSTPQAGNIEVQRQMRVTQEKRPDPAGAQVL
jgi:hypothetical protein